MLVHGVHVVKCSVHLSGSSWISDGSVSDLVQSDGSVSDLVQSDVSVSDLVQSDGSVTDLVQTRPTWGPGPRHSQPCGASVFRRYVPEAWFIPCEYPNTLCVFFKHLLLSPFFVLFLFFWGGFSGRSDYLLNCFSHFWSWEQNERIPSDCIIKWKPDLGKLPRFLSMLMWINRRLTGKSYQKPHFIASLILPPTHL